MKLIISATNRKNANSLHIARILKKLYQEEKEEVEILDLKDVPFEDFVKDPYGKEPSSLKPYLKKVAEAKALIIVCPEYNGGIPGLIKHFIDHWIYPDSFVYKPVSFVGLGGKFGAFNPISHLQGIFLYRHSFVFPIRVFIQNVSEVLKDGEIKDENIQKLLSTQTKNFIKFCKALKSQSFK